MAYCLLCWWERNPHPRVMGKAKQRVPNNENEIAISLLITYSQPGEDLTFHAGPHRGCTWDQSEPAEPVGSRPCGQHQEGGEEFFGSNRRRLFYLNGSVLQGSETQYSGRSRSCTGSLDEEGYSVRELIRGSWVGKWFVVKPFEILPILPNVKGTHRSGLSLKVIKMLSCFPLKVYHFAFHISVYDLSGTGF